MIFCKTRTVQVDFNNRLWPCCWVLQQWEDSEYLTQLNKIDPDWNNLEKHDIEIVFKHDAFTTHFNDEHWNNDKCDTICKKECSIKDE